MMAHFGRRSCERRDTCDRRLILIADEGIKYIDFAITHGRRSDEEQAVLWSLGRDENGVVVEPKKVVTWAKPGQSKHNYYPSLAFDFAPWVNGGIPWEEEWRFAEIGGMLMQIAREKGIQIFSNLSRYLNISKNP